MPEKPEGERRAPMRPAMTAIAALSFGILAATPVASVVTSQGGTATPTASPTPTRAGALPCVGDCNEDEVVSVAELIKGISMALGEDSLDSCPAFDFVADQRVMLDELIMSVAASNEGCGKAPTPTATATPGEATLAEIQDTIFTPRCAIISCHAGAFPTNDLSLEEGQSHGSLVGREPFNPAAADLGLLLVDPGNPDNSFLVVKVEGPDSFALGERMPLFTAPLTSRQIQLIRDWIAQGANP